MAPAFAGDDGAAPIWVGIGSMFGFGGSSKDQIEYQEHGKLVQPPKMDLPPPGLSKTEANPAWPQNQEKVKANKAAELERSASRCCKARTWPR